MLIGDGISFGIALWVLWLVQGEQKLDGFRLAGFEVGFMNLFFGSISGGKPSGAF